MRWTSSSSRPVLACSLALVVAEAAWASLLVNAVFDTGRGPRVQIGVLTLAIPAAAAVAVGAAITGRLRGLRRRWLRTLLQAVVVVAGTALSAGIIAELAVPGSFPVVASHPWAAAGHRAAVVAGVAWFLAVLAWGRVTSLRVAPPSSAQAAWSIGLGTLAFIGVFAGRTDAHASAFLAATSAAGWLLFLAFPCAVAALALIRQGELHEEVAPGAPGNPGPVWMSVLSVPMVATALVALLVAVAVGPLAPTVGRGLSRAAKAVWWVIVRVATALWHLLPKTAAHSVHRPAARAGSPHAGAPGRLAHTHAGAAPLVLEVVVGVAALVAVGLVIRWLRPIARFRHRAPTARADDETDSVFGWRHLLAQMWSAVRGLFTRRRRAAPAPVGPPAGGTDDGLATVRLAYRGVLEQARAAGWPRSPSETTGEVERRLAAGPASGRAIALAELTALYDAVRYGERSSDELEDADAVVWSDAVRRAIADRPDAQAALEG